MKRKTMIGLICAVVTIGVVSFTISSMFIKSKSSNENQNKEKIVVAQNNTDEEKAKLEEEKKKLDEEKAKLEQEKQKAENEKLRKENESLKKREQKSNNGIKIDNSKKSYQHLMNVVYGFDTEVFECTLNGNDGVDNRFAKIRSMSDTLKWYLGDFKSLAQEGTPKDTVATLNNLIRDLSSLSNEVDIVVNSKEKKGSIDVIMNSCNNVQSELKDLKAICENHGVHPMAG